jgi:hypothetical protein
MASGAEVLNSTEIYDWAHGRRRFGRRKSMPFGIYSRTLRTLRAMCEPVGRAPTRGSPWLWPAPGCGGCVIAREGPMKASHYRNAAVLGLLAKTWPPKEKLT